MASWTDWIQSGLRPNNSFKPDMLWRFGLIQALDFSLRSALSRIPLASAVKHQAHKGHPITGDLSTADIACWFIDTNYNGESFFVRHAYFTGGDQPYEKLQRALKAEVDEAAWAELYATKSRPFDRPDTGKIAVKVINHDGDEVLKVFGV